MSKIVTIEEIENGLSDIHVIELAPVFKGNAKERILNVGPVQDATFPGRYLGVEHLSEREKEERRYWIDPKKVRLKISKDTKFDMRNERDKLNWLWVKHLNEVAMSLEEAQMNKNTLFYVDIKEVEDIKALDSDMKMLKAMELVNKDAPSNYASRVRLLGYNMEDETYSALKTFLFGYAKNPAQVDRLIEVYESSTLSIQLLFLKARDKNIIQLVNGAFIYGGKVIGVTEDSVLKYLQAPENGVLLQELSKEVNPELHPAEPEAEPISVPIAEPIAAPKAKTPVKGSRAKTTK